jgi:ATP-dependent protease ClpP protease subunit
MLQERAFMKKLKKPEARIQIIGAIDEVQFTSFSEALSEYEEAGTKRVRVELSSEGGNAYDALAFYSRMRLSPCEITVVAFGLVASAAVLILAAGDTRIMTRESWVMVHEDSVRKMSGKVTEVEKFGRHMRRLEDQWNRLLAKSSTLSAEGWGSLHKAETYLMPEDCLKHGLIERII